MTNLREQSRRQALTASTQRTCLYTAAELGPVLDAMAHAAAAQLAAAKQVAMVGILRRGVPLGEMLRQRLQPLLGGRELPLYPLELKRYADDLSLLHPETALTDSAEIAALDFTNTSLLVVDDVLYGGYSLLRATAWLVKRGAMDVRTAVLVDRGAARVPVHAGVVGLRLDVAPGDIIECHVPPYEAEFRIDLCRRGAG